MSSEDKEGKYDDDHNCGEAGHNNAIFSQNIDLMFVALSFVFLALVFGLSCIRSMLPLYQHYTYGINDFYTTKEAYEAISK